VLLVAQLKLLPTEQQANQFVATADAFRKACNYASAVAFDTNTRKPAGLQKLVYRTLKKDYGLGAQSACLSVRTVCAAYTTMKANNRPATKPAEFHENSATVYDCRNFSADIPKQTISLWTTTGRVRVAYQQGERQQNLLASGLWKQADLILRDGSWFLFVSVELPDPPLVPVADFLGVDLGVANVASDSDGNLYSGQTLKNVRYRHRRLRTKLQRKGTKSAKRLLVKLSGKEYRFASWVNHNISKELVRLASGTGRGIALEDLTNIRNRVTARKRQRAVLHSWSFSQLRQFVAYKAVLAGVAVVFVDPAYTSRTCSECGCRDKRNRPSQSVFHCVSCGHSGHADLIASENIRRAAVNQPNARNGLSVARQSPRL